LARVRDSWPSRRRGIAMSNDSAASDLRVQLLGTWRMLSWKRVLVPSAEESDALGSNPFGYISYAPDGRLMVFVLKSRRPKPRSNAFAGREDRALRLTLRLCWYVRGPRRPSHPHARRKLERTVDRHHADEAAIVRRRAFDLHHPGNCRSDGRKVVHLPGRVRAGIDADVRIAGRALMVAPRPAVTWREPW
jgi:hypothetical protein